MSALDLGTWTPLEIGMAWAFWLDFVPAEKAELFRCGAAMFLCDIGYAGDGVEILAQVDLGQVVSKWRYLYDKRPDFRVRYAPLFAYLESQGAI